jgi:hypothetical protein
MHCDSSHVLPILTMFNSGKSVAEIANILRVKFGRIAPSQSAIRKIRLLHTPRINVLGHIAREEEFARARRQSAERYERWGPLRRRPRRRPARSNHAFRDRAIYLARNNGFTLREIAKLHGLSSERIRRVCFEEEARQRDKRDRFRTKSRPIDMGGPRDVWITEDIVDAQ